MIKMFKNADAYVRGRGIVKTDITFGSEILEIGGGTGEVIPLPEDALVLPAFIDIHTHGAAGCDFMDGSENSLGAIDGALSREGTAYYLATTMTQSAEKINDALAAIAKFKEGDNGLLGVHLEGPFISKKRVGAQSPDFVSPPDCKLFDGFLKSARGLIRTVTLAPEVGGAVNFIKYLVKKGVAVSIGHSDATFDEAEAAAEAGADKVTHTFNAQSGVHHRDIGVAGCALSDDRLYTELIADGIHVSYTAIKLLLKCKPQDRVILITDAMRAKGAAGGESELGGQKVYVRGGEARLADGTLAGSVLKMNEAVKNLVERAGASLEYAVDCASYNPAKYLKLEGCGSIAPKNQADFTVTDRALNVLMTVRRGKIIYRK